jgi:hypothetical protein
MELAPGFAYQPTTPPVPTPAPAPVPAVPPPDLGALEGLVGSWAGRGLNTIWRPNQPATGSDRFLEINVTQENLEFDVIPGTIPNRGLLQGDLLMTGVRYLQQISDSNEDAGLHIEPGLWLSVPLTINPAVPATVARLASIPHGTTIVAQGLASTNAGGPAVPTVSITPFAIGNPGAPVTFPEQTLATQSNFRTSGVGLTGVTQAMLDNPNSVLTTATAGQAITTTTTLVVSSDDTTPILGGGTANTAFLQGGPGGPNAVAARVDATFWIQTTQGSPAPDLLQYSQVVLLNFNGLSWPHVTVATLKKQPPAGP